MKLKMLIFASAVMTVITVHAQTDLDFSTSNSNNWTVTAGNLVNATPFGVGGGISITSNDSSPYYGGTPLPGLNLADFDGFWTATYTFSLPSGAANVSLNYSSLSVDDRVVLELNGAPIGDTGIYSPGEGSMIFTDGGPNESYYFSGPDGDVSGTVTNGFIVGGQNTITAIINNTEAGIYGGLEPLYYGTSFGVSGTISFNLESSGGLAVKGRVLDAISHQRLSGVSMSLAGQNTTTLSNGTYSFANVSLASGNTLNVSMSGYMTAALTITPPTGASILTVPDVLLQITASANQPVVTSLNSTLVPVFISGLPITDDFTATVNWNGSTPGVVDFYANNQLIKSLSGAGPTYTMTLDSSYFNPSLAVGGNTLSVIAQNSQGTASTPSSVFIYDVPYPQPLALVFPPSGFQTGAIP